ncbi:hypothetical protein CR513_00542, partial [Mucuna pruriens]
MQNQGLGSGQLLERTAQEEITLSEGANRTNLSDIIDLMIMDRNMINAASDGALMDKTPVVARHLISNMVDINMGDSRIRIGNMIVSSIGGSSINRVQVKGNIQSKDPDYLGACRF